MNKFEIIEQYQEDTKQTALYPRGYELQNTEIAASCYVIFGLIGECCEFLEKITENGYTDYAISAEIGDIFWYLSQICNELGCFTLAELFSVDLEYFVTKTQIDYKNIYVECGIIANCYKKVIRDMDGYPNEFTQNKLKESLQRIVLYLEYYISTMGSDITIESIMQKNIEKLLSRKKRGVIKGDGDNR